MAKSKLSSFFVDISPAIYTNVRCAEVERWLNRRLREHLIGSAYDNMGTFFQRRQATTFVSDSYAYYRQFSSGNCIGLTLGLLESILNYCRSHDEIMSLPPLYVIPATLPVHYGRIGEFGHVALLMVCADGVILLDSGFHIPKAIVLKNQEEVTLTTGGKIWRFQLDSSVIYGHRTHITGVIRASVETPQFGREPFTYALHHIANPDVIILQDNRTNTRRLAYVKRDGNGVQSSHITICLPEQRIKMSLHDPKTGKYEISELNFASCKANVMDKKLRGLGCPRNLIDQINYFILREQLQTSTEPCEIAELR